MTSVAKIKLVPFARRHLGRTFLWMQDEKLKRDFLFRKTVTAQQHRKWFSSYQKDATQKIFAVLFRGTHCGNCGFKNISLVDKKAEIWIYIGDRAYRGRGIARQAVAFLIQYARRTLQLKKLYLHVADFNKPARRLYTCAGFKKEGTLRHECRLGRKFVTLIRMYYLI